MPPYTRTFYLPGWVILPVWFVLELVAALTGTQDGVAYWAHVGGFVAGALAGLAFRRFREIRPDDEPPPSVPRGPTQVFGEKGSKGRTFRL